MAEIGNFSGSVSVLKRSASLFAIIAAMSAGASSVEAQTAATSPVESVVVTASRVARPGYEAPTPTTVLSVETLENRGLTSIADLLQSQPAFRNNSSQASTPFGFNSTGANTVNLRNLGGNRTLTLVDGARFFPADLNVIPSIMIARTDVVTGGASAGYGSDAVAGVVNIILQHQFDGVKGEASGGISDYGDNLSSHVGLLGGIQITDKLHAELAAEFDKTAGLPSIAAGNKRTWVQEVPFVFTGAGGVRYLALNGNLAVSTPGGIIDAGPLKGIAFANNGTPYQFTYGNFFGNPSNFESGGGNSPNTNQVTADIINPLMRENLRARFDYDAADWFHAYLDLGFSYNGGTHPSVPVFDPTGPNFIVIKNDNAYLPASIKTAMAANNVTSFNMGRVNLDIPLPTSKSYNTFNTVKWGWTGTLTDSWKWDGHFTYSNQRTSSTLFNNRIDANFFNATDAVLSSNGTIVCRSTLTTPTNGCVPFDPFGTGNLTPGAANYFLANSHVVINNQEVDTALNIQGEPFSTWAGQVSVAGGVEYHRDHLNQQVSALDLARTASGTGIFNLPAANTNIVGSTDVVEGYLEAVVPLLSNVTLAKELDFDGAVRQAHYSTAGDATTWKVSLNYQVTDELRLRASDSADLRAPSITENFNPPAPALNQFTEPQGTATIGGQTYTFTGRSILHNVVTSGNPNLVPETAKTYSAGIVYTPDWADGLHASADYYNINITNVIANFANAQIANNCVLLHEANFCSLLTVGVDAGGPFFSSVRSGPVNANSLKTSGWDFEIGYRTPLSALSTGLDGALEIDWYGNYIDHLIQVVNGVATDRAGEVGGGLLSSGPDAAHFVWDGDINYVLNRFSANMHIHFISHSKFDIAAKPGQIVNAVTGLNDNDIPQVITVGIGGAYTLSDQPDGSMVQLFANINNLGNVSPPLWAQQVGNGRDGTNANYDIIGRFYRVGVRFKY
jgi:outer membrane receptor protein involved in Fe transport